MIIYIMLTVILLFSALSAIALWKMYREFKEYITDELGVMRSFLVKLIRQTGATIRGGVVPNVETNNEELQYQRELEAEVDKRRKEKMQR